MNPDTEQKFFEILKTQMFTFGIGWNRNNPHGLEVCIFVPFRSLSFLFKKNESQRPKPAI